MDRDDFVNEALADAGLPLFRVKAAASYNVADLQKGIANAVTPPPAKPAKSATPAIPPTPVASAASAPTCPTCGATMILRTAKKGDRAGENFWGCPAYPNCRTTLPHDG